MQTKIEVDKEVMTFTNNVLRAKADGKALDSYLDSEMHKKWWQAVIECQQTVRIYVNEDYKEFVDLNRFGCIGNPGNGFTEFFKQTDSFFTGLTRKTLTQDQLNTLAKQGYFAPPRGHDQGREYTKYRVIVSEVPMINKDGSVTKMKVITTCAPNLMGTNDIDADKLVDRATGKVKQEAYKNTCDEIATLVVHAAKENNIKPLKISQFGLGVFIDKLSEEEKKVARRIMYKSFADASEKYKQNIDWLIWSKEKNCSNRVNELNNDHFRNYTYIKAESGDLIADVQQWKAQDANVGELNNGSDRTIGGHITAFKPKTTEEQLAQASLLVFVQTKSNPHFLNQCSNVKVSDKQHFNVQTMPSSKVTLDFRESKRNDDKTEFSFKSKSDADSFANLLKLNNIKSSCFESRSFYRVVFEGQHRQQALGLISSQSQPAISKPVTNTNTSNTVNSPPLVTQVSNSQAGFFDHHKTSKTNASSTINASAGELRLMEGKRQTKKGLSCYEITCTTEKQQTEFIRQINNYKFEEQIDAGKIEILETMFWNGSYRIKISPTPEALECAKTLIPLMNYNAPSQGRNTNY